MRRLRPNEKSGDVLLVKDLEKMGNFDKTSWNATLGTFSDRGSENGDGHGCSSGSPSRMVLHGNMARIKSQQSWLYRRFLDQIKQVKEQERIDGQSID